MVCHGSIVRPTVSSMEIPIFVFLVCASFLYSRAIWTRHLGCPSWSQNTCCDVSLKRGRLIQPVMVRRQTQILYVLSLLFAFHDDDGYRD